MFGIPPWAWALVVVAVAVFFRVRAFYAGFRRVCRRAREELTELIRKEYPGVEVTGERMGNLVLRTPDQPELVWELADLYADVARLPGMGVDPAARHGVYRAHANGLLAPHLNPATPVSPETHGGYLLPQLDVHSSAAGPGRDLPGTGLRVSYVFKLPGGVHPVLDADAEKLGLAESELYERAVANLGRDFPAQMLESVAAGEGSALQVGDGFDAARILLLPPHLREGQTLLALVPHRDMLLLLPAEMETDADKLREALQMLSEEHGHHPLTASPLRVTRDGFQTIHLASP